MKKRVIPRILSFVVAATMLVPLWSPVIAKDAPPPLYVSTTAKYPAPALSDVDGREYKILFDPAKTSPDMATAFKDLWEKIKAAAAKQGLQVTEKDKNPLAIEFSTKEYFDTPDQALWSKGYLIRITTRYKDGKPNDPVAVTVKAVFEDAMKALAVPLAVVGVDKVKTEAEENVGFGPDGSLRGYIEKGSSFSVPQAALGKFTLGDFGKYMPELLKLGLAGRHAVEIHQGLFVPGASGCRRAARHCAFRRVSMEAWSRTEGGAAFLYDFSFGYSDLDYYAVAATHAAGEQFMTKVMKDELGALASPDSGKWGGSKVRQLMNRPVPAVVSGGSRAGDFKSGRKPRHRWASTPPPRHPSMRWTSSSATPCHRPTSSTTKPTRPAEVLINPYLQVASKDFPAVLVVKEAPYNWVIDANGNVAIIPEAAHPYGRTYPNGFFRPEDQSTRKPGTRERTTATSRHWPARPVASAGKSCIDKDTNTWVINNKSGRYTKHNPDRSPEQLDQRRHS
jgi:hypothetical protein